MVALRPATSDLEEVVALLLGLDAFCDRAQLERLCELHDRSCQVGSMLRCPGPASMNERSIFKMSMGSVLRWESDE